MRAHGAFGVAALLLVSTRAAGQPDPVPYPTPAIPISSHAVTADDFPADSISRGEQGTVRVRFLIGESGDVTECTITESSGYVRLDEAACKMIRDRWKYTPATQDGKAVTQVTTANVEYRYSDVGPAGSFADLLKFQNAAKGTAAPSGSSDPSQSDPGLDVPQSQTASQPTCPAEPCMIAIPITSHVVMLEDFPPESVWLGEQGPVQVRYVVSETGDVTECNVTHSSGYPRLDAAACTMIRNRWKYRPAIEGGKTITQVNTANIVFELRGGGF